MKIIDIVIALLLLLGAYQGYKKGLLVEIISLLAFIIAVVSAFKLMHDGIHFLTPYLKEYSRILPFSAFIFIFLIVFISIQLLGRLLKKTISYSLLGKFDSYAGGVFGLISSAFALSLIIWLVNISSIDVPSHVIKEAYIYEFLTLFAPRMISMVSHVIPFQDIFSSVKDLILAFKLN